MGRSRLENDSGAGLCSLKTWLMVELYIVQGILDWLASLLDAVFSFFHWIGDWCGVLVDTLAVIVALYVFIIYAYIPVVRPLRKILARQGLSFREASLIAWKCRSNTSLYMRFYLEMAIIQNRGEAWASSDWKNLRKAFSKKLREYREMESQGKDAEFLVSKDNCSHILSENFKDLVKAYFDLFDPDSAENRKSFFHRRFLRRISDATPDRFRSVLEVKNGYMAPISRIVGLNDRYEQNWQAIMENYRRTLSKLPERPERDPGKEYRWAQALGFTYTWLMWGPSLQTWIPSEKSEAGTYSLGIYGCGDEANSLYVLFKEPIRQVLRRQGDFCLPCTVKGRICNPVWYMDHCKGDFDARALPFAERVAGAYRYQTSFDYLLELEELQPEKPVENGTSDAHYFTGYVWAMFLHSDNGHPEFSLADTVVFFEHANLAYKEKSEMEYIHACLTEKIARYLSHARPGKYHFCCAMNQDTEDYIRQHLEEKGLSNIEWGGVPGLDAARLLENIDSHFSIRRWEEIDRTSYADVVRLCAELQDEKRLTELFHLLAKADVRVVGARNDHGELEAAGIHVGKTSGENDFDMFICKPSSEIREEDVARHFGL